MVTPTTLLRWHRDFGAAREDAWVDIVYPDGGVAQVAETRYRGDRLIVRRTRLVGEQAELFPNWRYHAFVTDRVGAMVWLDADHRRHAVVELAIRDLKAGGACVIIPRAGSPPTPPGCWRPRLPTTCCAGSPPSGWARGGLVVAKTLRRTMLALR